MKLRAAQLFALLKDAVMAFNQDNAPRLAAALAYYAISSIGPILFLIITAAGIFLSGSNQKGEASQYITEQINQLVQNALGSAPNSELAQNINTFVTPLVENLSKQFDNPGTNTIAIMTGLVTLFLTSTGLFLQLQGALNTMWEVKPKPGLLEMVRTRVVGFLMVLVFGALVVAYVAGNTYLSTIAKQLGDSVGQGTNAVRLGSSLLAMLFFTPVFAATYKWLPAVKLQWRQVWIGGAVTAVLFVLAQAAIGVYFARATPGSVYGGASTLFIVLLWIYFSSMVVFFGAEVTWVYTQRSGERVEAQGERLSSHKTNLLPKAPAPNSPRTTPPFVPPVSPPTVSRATSNVVLALLALPSVLVLRVLALFGWVGPKKPRR